MGRLVTLATILALCWLNSADAVGETKHVPLEKNVQGLIQAGYPRERAEEALRAVGNADCCTKQIHWLFEQNKKRAEEGEPKKMSSECHKRDATDYDGYAVKWGSANVQETWEACCESCKNYKPEAPHFYPCNIWVFCPEKDGCFAPAAGDFIHGQCWLKFQEDPTNPHVNMRGDYSAEYRKTHPSAPKSVQWVAGSIVEEGQTVGNGTWSSRSHWRR